MPRLLSPIAPGEILKEEFLTPFGLSEYRLARDIRVPPRRINEIVHGTRAITADTALRLGHYFNVSARFWMNLQNRYDLDTREEDLQSDLANIQVFSLPADRPLQEHRVRHRDPA